MAEHVAILDWADVRSLIAICSQGFPRDLGHFDALESARLRLVDSVHGYLEKWPGNSFDDGVRIRLLGSLDFFANALEEAKVGKATRDE